MQVRHLVPDHSRIDVFSTCNVPKGSGGRGVPAPHVPGFLIGEIGKPGCVPTRFHQ
ncbi:hypothetical protein GCM10010365_57940 [Streptomyces poonensis]|uniref:Uncharacterized protein n=1 Tax=Streptomyces poonensis TaxID=68255 RepID=A0A918Q1G7_9ACTN|nr:hypothetical protein [Streptomyces poonensis]GGZ29924.1 hypothetical protein GCM10010365_57940 [Streptomyces poonensis]